METVREKLVDEIEGIDWYHVNQKGKLVHGSTSEYESYWKCADVMAVIERVLQDVTDTNDGHKWVSAEELPKKDGEYIVLIEGAKKATSLYYSVKENIWFDGVFNMYKVTCWQPMPQPPKGVQ